MANIELPVVSKPKLYLRPSTNLGKNVQCAVSSAHDLIALPAEGGDVIVLRLNGQVAFSCRRKNASVNAADDDATVSALEWKPDGNLLAIGWSDGAWAIVSGENGRVFSRGAVKAAGTGEAGWKLDLRPDFGGEESDEECDKDERRGVHLFGWSGSKASAIETAHWQDNDYDSDFDAYDDLDDTSDPTVGKQIAAAVSLPYRLATIDAAEVLPRLSALPSHGMPFMKAGPEGNKFSSQAATDALFPSTKTASSPGAVGTLLICTGRGETEVLLEESISVGTIRVPTLLPELHEASFQSSAHILLCRSFEKQYTLASIRLSSLGLENPLLHVVTSNARRIQNILSYITYTVRCIQHDFTTGLAFPTRLINNINMELEEKSEGNLVSNLYHLAMTTNFTPTIFEWLTDIVKDPNHKRWHSAVETMYQQIQTHSFAHILPALDRLSVAAATLRGHAKFHEDSSEFGVSPELFTNIMNCVDATRLIVQRLLLVIMDESKQFRAFSKWLKVMIDVGSAGPFTKTANEIEEREFASLDFGLATQYIKGAMTSSQLGRFIGDLNTPTLRGECPKDEWLRNDVVRSMTYENVKSALVRHDSAPKDGKPLSSEEDQTLLNLPVSTMVLNGHARACIDAITTWQSGMLKPPRITTLDAIQIEQEYVSDMRLISQVTGRVAVNDDSDNVALTVMEENGSSCRVYFPSLRKSIPIFLAASEGKALDAKFLSQSILILLCETEDGKRQLHEAKVPSQEALTDSLTTDIIHHFDESQSSFRPTRIVLGDRPGKEVCIIFDDNRDTWMVLDISAKARRNALFIEEGTDDEGFADENMDVV